MLHKSKNRLCDRGSCVWSHDRRVVVPILAILVLAHLGCGDEQAPRIKLRTNVAAAEKSDDQVLFAPLSIKVSQPAPEQKFRTDQPIECEFTVSVPAGALPPSSVVLQLKRGRSIVDSWIVDPIARGNDGSIIFSSNSLKTPSRPGTYSISVDAGRMTRFGDSAKKRPMRQENFVSADTPIKVDAVDGTSPR